MIAHVTIGIPASGKSYWAEQLGITEINRDKARFQLFGNQRSHVDEKSVTHFCHNQIQEAAFKGLDVVISDTNLIPDFRYSLVLMLKELGYEVHAHVFNTHIDVCISRNNKRSDPIPNHVMYKMQERFDNFPPEVGLFDKIFFVR